MSPTPTPRALNATDAHRNTTIAAVGIDRGQVDQEERGDEGERADREAAHHAARQVGAQQVPGAHRARSPGRR